MSYTRTTDFVALLRNTGNGERFLTMPGLDFLISGLAAAGMFLLWIDPVNPPNTNQATTVWLKTSTQSYAAEASVWLWNAATATFLPATPQLWAALFVAQGA